MATLPLLTQMAELDAAVSRANLQLVQAEECGELDILDRAVVVQELENAMEIAGTVRDELVAHVTTLERAS